jgi:hypothetical protein
MPPGKRFGAGIRGKEEREEEKEEEEEEEEEGLERFFLCFVSVTESWRRRRNPRWSGKSEQAGSCCSCCCVDDALGSEEYKSLVVCFFLVLFWI